MKKVLFVVPNLKMGGIQRVTSVIANELNQVLDVDMLAYDSSNIFYDVKINSLYGLNKLEYYRFLFGKVIRKTSYSLFKKTINPKFVYHSLINRVSILHHKNKYDTIVLIASSLLISSELKKLFDDVKIISWTHNSADTYFNNYFKREGYYLYDALKSSDNIIALTESDKLKYGRYNPNTIHIFNPLTIHNNKISNLENKVISFVGRISIEHKGIDYLCEVVSLLPEDWKVSVAGNGSENEMKRFKALMNHYGVKDRFILRGQLKDEELKNHFINSSIYVMTSRWEGFGLVITEAMSFGLPIVAFNQTGSVEILANGEFGILIKNGDTRAMAKEINQLIEDFDYRRKYSEKSLIRVKDFQKENIVSKWLNII